MKIAPPVRPQVPALSTHTRAWVSDRWRPATLSCVRHRAILLSALGDIEMGAQALSEIDFVRLCRRHRLPPPIQQAVRLDPSGRRRYLDAHWLRPDGRELAVEVDGALHMVATTWWADQLRQNELALTGAVTLRYASAVVRTEEQYVAAQLRRALLRASSVSRTGTDSTRNGFPDMDDSEILNHIHELVEEEKRLRAEHTGEGLRGADRGRLQILEEKLDQAWDLLRRRRAQQEAGTDETETAERSADQVEHYLQ